MTKLKDARRIKKNAFNSKQIIEEKQKRAIEWENLNERNEALKIFSQIDINKNNKYNL